MTLTAAYATARAASHALLFPRAHGRRVRLLRSTCSLSYPQRHTTPPHSQISSRPATSSSQISQIWLPDARATESLGRFLASTSLAGDVILLYGDLGAGKTALARGYIQKAHGSDEIQVTSPTYLLTNFYPSPAPKLTHDIYHMDLWRLESASKRPIVDFDNVFTTAVALIEWPDRLGDLTPANRLDVFLEYPQPSVDDSTTETRETDDDPWGFGSGEPEDTTSSRSGRFASLVPHGQQWQARVQELHKRLISNPSSSLLLPNDHLD